jgi:hypothetical protein
MLSCPVLFVRMSKCTHHASRYRLQDRCTAHDEYKNRLKNQIAFASPTAGAGFDYTSDVRSFHPQTSSHLLPSNSTGPSNVPKRGGPVPGSGRHIHSLIHPGTSCLL